MSATLMAKLACLFGLRAGNDKQKLLSLGLKTRVSRVLLLCVQRKLRKGSSGYKHLNKRPGDPPALNFPGSSSESPGKTDPGRQPHALARQVPLVCKNEKGGREAAERPCPQNPNAMYEGLRTYVIRLTSLCTHTPRGKRPLRRYFSKPCLLRLQSRRP